MPGRGQHHDRREHTTTPEETTTTPVDDTTSTEPAVVKTETTDVNPPSTTVSTGTLARTGADSSALAFTGFALLLAGAILALRGRAYRQA